MTTSVRLHRRTCVFERQDVGIYDTYCSGAAVHASLVYRSLSLVPRLGGCRESFASSQLASATTEMQTALGLNLHRDLGRRWSIYLGPELGVSYFHQTITPTNSASASRNLFGGTLALQGGADLDVGGGFSLGARITGQTYFLELQNPTRPPGGISAVFAWGGGLGITRYFW
jgi:hypothetical protein